MLEHFYSLTELLLLNVLFNSKLMGITGKDVAYDCKLLHNVWISTLVDKLNNSDSAYHFIS